MRTTKNWLRLAYGMGFALVMGCGATASAQTFPTKPVTLVVPFPAGGITDATARIVARKLSEELKQPVVVDNKPGAGASIGANVVAKAAPDGYTVLLGTLANMVVNTYVYGNTLPYRALTDFAPVYGVAAVPIVIVANHDRPYKNLRAMLEAAQAKPGSLTFASSGNGSVTHLASELLQTVTKTSLVHVPYKGSAPAITDLLGGTIDMAFDYASTTEPHIRSGKLTPLAVTSPKRVPTLPDVPTVAELGYPKAEVLSWMALFAPAATPQPVLVKLSEAMGRVLQNKDSLAELRALGSEAFAMEPAQLKSFVASEDARWKPIIEKAGIKPN